MKGGLRPLALCERGKVFHLEAITIIRLVFTL